MPQMTREYCTRCKASVFNCIIDGKRVPTLIRIVVGVPEDVGTFDINGDGVRTTAFTREMMQTPLARMELCEKCFSEVFRLALVTAQEDEMYSAGNPQIAVQLKLDDASVSRVERMSRMHTRALHAIAVGRGEASVADLPAEYQAPSEPDTRSRI